MSCGTKVPLLPLISSTFITEHLYAISSALIIFSTAAWWYNCIGLRCRLWDFAACATSRARAAAPAAAILYCSATLISMGRAFWGSSGDSGQGSMAP